MSTLKVKDDNNTWVSLPIGGVGVPSGGSKGQILAKSSSTDYATEWITPSQEIFVAVENVTTNAEIETAFWANKFVIVYHNNKVYSLTRRASATSHWFAQAFINDNFTPSQEWVLCSNNSWLAGYINVASTSMLANIRYYTSQTVNVASSAEIFRITASSITANTIVLSCVFADPINISGDVTWTSYNGYIAFNGTCTAATTANVILAQKSN